ncbi:YicC/YloC family endoribonuclease [Bacteroides propionicifaciens]|uniref:YicC/YloC family endoribonuclease n=1 Tax=Bacteroides propionicifaciens TaxID=392838 RepID=UPI00039C10A3|nr:YicC/YloC family endoribonuclease [Bacteroides propionicifaciens]
MIQSMTGYGKAVANLTNKKITIEVKSLNSKSLDLSTRIAPSYRDKEIEIRQLLSNRIARGKVDFNLWVEKDDLSDAAVIVNEKLIESYYKQINSVAQNLNLPLPADWFQTLLRMPDVLTKPEVEEVTDEEWKEVMKGINEAVDHLVTFRNQEGEALETKFQHNIEQIAQLLKQVEPYDKERIEKVRERITDSLENALDVEYDNNRLEQELIFYIEKLDVNEEKQRLNHHLDYFITTLNGEAGQGKKLGFISQEIGREINTLGSKSNHAEMQKIVVQMKDELEQIKEQVLNVL